MDITTLKQAIIDKIQTTKSNELLEEINRFLNSQDIQDSDTYQLNDEQKSAISEAREDINGGRYSTDEAINADFKQWLNK